MRWKEGCGWMHCLHHRSFNKFIELGHYIILKEILLWLLSNGVSRVVSVVIVFPNPKLNPESKVKLKAKPTVKPKAQSIIITPNPKPRAQNSKLKSAIPIQIQPNCNPNPIQIQIETSIGLYTRNFFEFAYNIVNVGRLYLCYLWTILNGFFYSTSNMTQFAIGKMT